MTASVSVPAFDSREATFRQWRAARERALAVPHGWLSPTSFHWLPDRPETLPPLPGRFSAHEGHAVLQASVDDGYLLAADEDGLSVPVDGEARARVMEAKSLEWLTLGEVVVELALRGGRYAIRTRDPQAPALLAFTGVPTFDFDEKWLLTGTYEPFEAPLPITVTTARADLHQSITAVGKVMVELNGGHYPLVATAGGNATVNIAFHDGTNGDSTARWRTVGVTLPGPDGRVAVDFNRALNLPFAFSDHGTCPAPPIGNTLPFDVTAGEKKPQVHPS